MGKTWPLTGALGSALPVLLAQRVSDRDIAEKLCMTEGIVKNHVSNLMVKLQAENRTRAADIARRHGLA